MSIFDVVFPNGHGEDNVDSVSVSMNACVPKFMDAERHQYMILDFEILDEESLVIVIRHLKRHAEGSK